MGPMVWELDGPGPILKNSSTRVMTGPFDFWTTSSSGETLDGCGAAVGSLLSAVGLVCEQAVRIAAPPKNVARASSRRLIGAASFLEPAVEQGSHPVELHVPQALAALLSTLSDFFIVG